MNMKGCIRRGAIVVFDNLDDECVRCSNVVNDYINVNCPLTHEERRQNKQTAHKHECFLCLNKNDARNKMVFNERFQIFISSVNFLTRIIKYAREKAEETERDKYYKIVHNLKHLNAEALGTQYNFIPQELLTENYRDLYSLVHNEIRKDIKGATLLLLKQAKINAHIKTEFDTHELLSMDNPVLDVRNHRVREVILNVYHPYERDFKEQNIVISFSPSIGYARFDYRTMRLAFAHILSNATKYVKPYTGIEVLYELTDSATIITFSMCSIVIKQDEVEKIFIDGISGSIPKANNLNGSGLGMGLIRKAVEMNNGTFTVIPGTTYTKKNGIDYADNSFVISLRK